jgi:CDP-glucose 4,6-dehydratase
VSFWQHRRVFVTGCTGFLGSWLTRELIERGADVVGLVRDYVPNSILFRDGLHEKMTVVSGPLQDYDLIERTLNEYEIDTVFHLAAQAIVGVANKNPMGTFETNIRGTWVLLEACRRSPLITRVVVASSDKAYGEHKTLPYDETFPLQGTHPYDVSKSCTDLISKTYHHTYGTPVCITRCGNLFGPGDLNFNRIVPGTMRDAILGRRPVIRSDGTPLRDYVYVQDIALAYLLLAERMEDESVHGKAYNFGTGTPLSVKEFIEKILVAAGRPDLEPDIQNTAGGEILHQYLSSDLAKKDLGWELTVPFEDRLKESFEWYRTILQASP